MLIQQFKDPARRGSEESEPRQNSTHPAKSQINTIATLSNEISSYLFKYLAGFRIPTHFMERVSSSGMLVRQLTMIPLKVCVLNVSSGDFAGRYGVKDGTDLAVPIIEHHFKNPDLGNPLVNEFHIYSLGLATPEQLRSINRLASKTNVVLRSFFERRELKLLSMSLEFGVAGNQMTLVMRSLPARVGSPICKRRNAERKTPLRAEGRTFSRHMLKCVIASTEHSSQEPVWSPVTGMMLSSKQLS